jgi:hypothetical protein
MTRVFGCILISLILSLITFANIIVVNKAYAQTPVPTQSSPTPTPDPTVVALQKLVATQQIEVETLKRDLDFEVREFRFWFFVAGVIGAITGLTGYRAYRGVDEQVRRKIQVLISKHYYQLDVTNLDIHIRAGLEKLEELLKNQGLYNISRFERLGSKSFSGITIFPITDESDEEKYLRFIRQYFIDSQRLSPKKVGFILYASTGYRIKFDTIDLFPTTAVANTPWNLVSTIMILGRSITPPPTYEDLSDE